jgi:dihydroorotate dehydrogenase
MNFLKFLYSIGFAKLLRALYKPRGDHRFDALNIRFPNRVGLGAGFDKNAKYLRELECLGRQRKAAVVPLTK